MKNNFAQGNSCYVFPFGEEVYNMYETSKTYIIISKYCFNLSSIFQVFQLFLIKNSQVFVLPI